MPPTKTIIVDVLKILESIRSIEAEQVIDANERMKLVNWPEEYRERERETARWVPRDLCLLAGRFLTPSERKRHQEALRQMERDGLIAIDTRHVMILDAGLAKLEKVESRTDA